jgi:hypothetical protein
MTRVLVVCAVVAAIAAPSVLAADPNPGDYRNAAKYCKAVRAANGEDAFQKTYGKNTNKKNAFGKCVAQTAKAKAAKREDAVATAKANADCKKQQAADPAKFAKDYKNVGQCIKAAKGTDGSTG